jgi:hypothetical protein
VDPDTLVRTVIDRTTNRIQDWTVSDEAVDRLFDRLAGPEGLTERASTFIRPEVLVALGAGLVGARRAVLEELADRFLAERAVSVVADRTLEERRWSTPELLAVEQRLVERVTCRADGRVAVASHQGVREALAAHPTAGADQQAMVRDLCQGGQGVAVVVGRAGTGKTFALGIARHAWQLEGYRLLAAAPTGIATMSLQGEGFEDVATCDRLLADLDRGQETLDSRTVLVMDEAGMVGSRKLARLLEHADQAQAKVVLVSEDRQLAVGDRVVCGHNAIAELGLANGSRSTITALDPNARTLTLRLDGHDDQELTLPRSYLDGRGRGERNRRVDLAYATTGHRAQGLTRGRALVRLTGSEDVNWLYVQLSRARHDTRLYAVVGPEPQGPGSWTCPIGNSRTATCSWPRPCPGLAARSWPSTPSAAQISSGCPRPSCGPSGTGCAASSTRLPATAAGSWTGHRSPGAG